MAHLPQLSPCGLVERIDWWQLVAKGYGLCDPQPDGKLRERPSFRALATLIRELAGTTCHGPLPASALPAAGRAYRFTRGAEEIVVAWSTAEAIDWPLVAERVERVEPAERSERSEQSARSEPYRIVDRDGDELPLTAESRRWCPSPRYFFSAVR